MPTVIKVFSDVVCPWCYIGKKRLEKAVSLLSEPIQISWLPYQLNPDMPLEGIDKNLYYLEKFGKEIMERNITFVTEQGEAEGISFCFEKVSRIPNTANAHRLLVLAEKKGVQNQLMSNLFHSYFTEGIEIGQKANLVMIGEQVGLSSDEVENFLESEACVSEVKESQKLAYAEGIRGVPHFVINGSLHLSGAQDPQTIINAIKSVV